MKSAFYAGATGLVAYQEALNTIGNNLANVNTNGFQSQSVSFQSLLNSDLYANTEKVARAGNGVRVVQSGISDSPVTYLQTGEGLDFAIEGEGWFAVEKNGQVQYTRDGNFSLGLEGRGTSLVTQDGGYVLDARGARITVTGDAKTGAYDYAAIREKLGVFRFQNAAGLTPVSANRYLAGANTGAATAVTGDAANVLSGMLERSSVSLVDEMARLIEVQRAYQISARVVQAADENEQTVNNLRR